MWKLIALLVLSGGFIAWLSQTNRKAGRNAEIAKQSTAKDEARRDAQKAETRVDGMSDDELRERMRKRSQR